MTNAVIELLQQRNACSKLVEPAPSASELKDIFKAALRAPDHANLRPWKFITVAGKGLERLGQLFVQAQLQNGLQLDAEQQQKLAAKPLRAPLIVAVVASVTEHPKVPDIEQIISASCAAQNILLAVESLGYGAIWRTGDLAYDDIVQDGLGLDANQMLLGFIYVGTKQGKVKKIPEHDLSQFVKAWE